ncbi:hypothetical protein HTG_02375 [Natrinema mahii]|nr:hypothetical protein HTG_02375 [Natrinema mahii]
MSLSTLLGDLFSDAESGTDTPETATESGDDGSVTVLHECRNCGTNVSAETSRCPACESQEIVTYSIE